jgi:hypothetical protein
MIGAERAGTLGGCNADDLRLADHQPVFTIAVGETDDFYYDAPAGRRVLWMNVRTPAGRQRETLAAALPSYLAGGELQCSVD